MITLELLWWIGWIYFAAWTALPLVLIGWVGPVVGAVAWAVLAPWTALLGMAIAHRLLPPCEAGTFRLFADRGSIRWAMKSWAPAVYLGVFQPIFFLNPGFQRVALRAFGARIGAGAMVTTRTSVREPHLVEIGRDTLIAEYSHLACSYQPRPHTLVVAPIRIGDRVLIGAHTVLVAGCRVGARSILEYHVAVGAHTAIGDDTRVGSGTCIFNGARIGNNVRIGKWCRIPTGAVVPDGARLADGTVWASPPAPAPVETGTRA